MKVAVLIAVLANFAVFFWLRWAAPGVPRPEAGLVPAPAVHKPLTLVGGAGTGARCLLLAAGPDATAAAARAARLRGHGFDARAVAESQSVARGYWVLLNGFGDVAAARAAADKLRRGGIKDLFVLNAADGGQASVSLGLFRDLAHARRRAAHVRSLGFSPQIRERFRSTPQWAVQVPATASARAAFPATAARPAACREPG